MAAQECCGGEAANWQLRVGPDYPRTGAKKPSLSALFTLAGVDVWKSKKPLRNVAERMRLPDATRDTRDLPANLVINLQLPACENPLFGSKETVNVVFTFSLREVPEGGWGAAEGLLRRFVGAIPHDKAAGASHTDAEVLSRFKLLCRVQEGVPKMFSSYNGKPVVVTGSGQFHCGRMGGRSGYLCVGVNMRKWNRAARGGLYSLWDKLQNFQIAVGACLEARSDEEMDERLLCTAQISRVNLDSAPPAPSGWS
eukprot:TRINITY_DN15585_c0_g1_i1.p1 TRINITY_DN15585_c0_g1~~TRINITY_DN15585_c0_g1_i1.p1  ORF type:complete len:254 (+),score=61.65 TRINITY_DN15585_c0_g1_i1:517-1278(+)